MSHTALDGTFLFENLPSGTYTIEVDASSRPQNAAILPTPALTVLLEPYGEVKDLLFLIQLPLRPVLRRQF